MPRGVHSSRVLPKLYAPAKPTSNKVRKQNGGPALYNAKRRVLTLKPISKRLTLPLLKQNPLDESWRKDTSEDVTQFIDDMEAQGTKLLPEEKTKLLVNPAHYFSRPQNVPNSLRQQVYFPDFTVSMLRNDYLGPQYAQFAVPKWFSKLDLKGYLKGLYNVDVLHIRSYVLPTKIKRRPAASPYGRGPVYRTFGGKRMTVQLVEPFVWPVKPDDVDRTLFGTEQFHEAVAAQKENQVQEVDKLGFRSYLNKAHRKSVAEQARDMLQGKMKWAPTWQEIPDMRRMMTGPTDAPQALTSTTSILPSRLKKPKSSGVEL